MTTIRSEIWRTTAEIVGDEQVREIELGLKLLEQVHDLRLDRDVERRDGLVADEELGVQGQRACEADPLALPPGELVGVAVGGIAGKADDLEQLLHPETGLASCRGVVRTQRLAHDSSD